MKLLSELWRKWCPGMLGLVLVSGVGAAENLVPNSSFEELIPRRKTKWKVEQVRDWTLYLNGSQTRGDINVVTPGYQSSHALELRTIGSRGYCSAHPASRFKVQPGDQVYAAVRLKGSGKGYIRLFFYDAAGKRLKNYQMQGLKASSEWQLLVLKFTVPDGVASLFLSLETLFDNARVTFDAAELQISRGPQLQNSALRVKIDPRLGGSVASFCDRATGFEFTVPPTFAAPGGLLNCIVPARRLPGVLSKAAGAWRLGPDQELIFSHRVAHGELAGLEIEKRFRLDPQLPRLTVDLKLRNYSTRELKITQRIQNCLRSDPGVWSYPTPDWVTLFDQGSAAGALVKQTRHDLFRAGWQAKRFANGLTLKISLPPHAVRRLYSYFGTAPAISTMEWYTRDFKLKPGAAWSVPITLEVLKEPGRYYADAAGKLQKTEELKSRPLPPPPPAATLPAQFQDFFTNCATLGNLVEPEMAGVASGRYPQLYCRVAQRLIRELSDCYINTISSIHIPHEHIQKAAWGNNSTHALGEVLKQQQMRLILCHLFLLRHHVDVAAYQKNVWPEKKALLTRPKFQKFVRQYGDLIAAFFTADELLPQNADVLLQVHQNLQQLLPPHVIAFPYLNSSTTELLPYLPIFVGDWYPIKRKNDSGRNPWSVYPEFRRVVKLAGASTPVWFMPQGFGYVTGAPSAVYALPTSGEYRLMLHLAAAAGVKGIAWHGLPNSTWPWMKNYFMYPFSPLGSAGQHHPPLQGIVDASRTLNTVGPLLTRAQVTKVPPEVRLACGNYTSFNQYYSGAAIKVFALQTPKGQILVAINQNPYAPEKGTLTLPPGRYFDFHSLQEIPGGAVKLNLKAGDARYFYRGTDWRELDPGFRSRFRAESARYNLLKVRAQADKIAVVDPEKFRTLPPRTALTALLQEYQALQQRIAAAPLGAVWRDLEAVRQELDRINFRLNCAMPLVVTPEMRKHTRRYRRWCAHPDAQFTALRDQLVRQFEVYYQLRDQLDSGKGSRHLAVAARQLRATALPVIKQVDAWLNAHPQKDRIDDPFEGLPNL